MCIKDSGMEALRSAFEDIDSALNEISRYRREALPAMAGTILELDQLTAETEEAITPMECCLLHTYPSSRD